MNQKSTLLICYLLFLGILYTTPTFGQECVDEVNCGVENGASQPDVGANSVIIDVNGTTSPVTQFSSTSTVFTDFQYVLNAPCAVIGENTLSTIVTLGKDGSFDFTDLEEGEYTVTLFAYSQAELDAFAGTANPLLQSLFSITIPCCPVELSAAFDVIGTALGIQPSIEDVEGALCDILPPLGLNLSYGIAEPFTVTVSSMVGTNFASSTAPENIQIAQIAPIPATNEVNVTLTTPTFKNTIINVYDITGQLMRTIPTVVNGVTTLTLAIDDFPQGVYFVQVTSDAATITERFVKQ